MHRAAMDFVESTIRTLDPPPSIVVDLGGRDVNGSPRRLFPGSTYVSVDRVAGPGVDVVADAATWTPVVQPDLVLCLEVLEHAENAAEIVANAGRILSPGGRLVVTCATRPRAEHSAIDGGPLRPGEFYRNPTPDELAGWLSWAAFSWVEPHEDRGDLYAFAKKPR